MHSSGIFSELKKLKYPENDILYKSHQTILQNISTDIEFVNSLIKSPNVNLFSFKHLSKEIKN
jgi:hypothetical protein